MSMILMDFGRACPAACAVLALRCLSPSPSPGGDVLSLPAHPCILHVRGEHHGRALKRLYRIYSTSSTSTQTQVLPVSYSDVSRNPCTPCSHSLLHLTLPDHLLLACSLPRLTHGLEVQGLRCWGCEFHTADRQLDRLQQRWRLATPAAGRHPCGGGGHVHRQRLSPRPARPSE